MKSVIVTKSVIYRHIPDWALAEYSNTLARLRAAHEALDHVDPGSPYVSAIVKEIAAIEARLAAWRETWHLPVRTRLVGRDPATGRLQWATEEEMSHAPAADA
ncbi:MAG: hypothetical protein K6V97_04135 [Actinomycetia bacterium]|nr:hypothetical protein [Actinomycetes bacterium]